MIEMLYRSSFCVTHDPDTRQLACRLVFLPAAAVAIVVAVEAHAEAQQSLGCTHLKGLMRTDTLMLSFAPLSGDFVELPLSKVGVWGRLAVLRADMAPRMSRCLLWHHIVVTNHLETLEKALWHTIEAA